jgi:hypothetical protein
MPGDSSASTYLLRNSQTLPARTEMEIELEHIDDSAIPNTFRVAFHSADKRCLLPYPCVTGLKFTDSSGSNAAQWETRYLVSEPLNDFVLIRGARFAFDLYAHINADCSIQLLWVFDLPSGRYLVHYLYRVDRDTDWYDFLAKRSRFAAITPLWRGSIQSNTIQFLVAPTNDAK